MIAPPRIADAALFLDFDGTLVDLAPRPDAVRVPPGTIARLERLADRLDGALAIVSGRPIAEIDAFLAPARFTVGGLHGLEWREDGSLAAQALAPPPSIAVVRGRIEVAFAFADGILVEDKGSAIAVHYRSAPEREAEVRAAVIAAAGAFDDLSLILGKMVVEVKPRAASKATVVERFLTLTRFSGRTPVFVGDDATDEDGMRAAIAAGGYGVKVGEGDSVAGFRLATVADVHAWLDDLPPARPGAGRASAEDPVSREGAVR